MITLGTRCEMTIRLSGKSLRDPAKARRGKDQLLSQEFAGEKRANAPRLLAGY